MKRWFSALCAVGLALSLGCATAVVRPYVGDQQAWPTASGSIVNTRYGMPVFTSLPPTPYDVLAEMRISSPFYAQPEEGHMPRLVKRAQKIGADALIFVQGKIFFSTNYGPRGGSEQDANAQKAPTLTTVNTFNPESFAPEVTILAIRWIGDAPPGLPSSKRTVAATPTAPAIAPTPAPAPEVTTAPVQAPTETAPQSPPPSSSENKDDQNQATAPSVDQSKPEAPAPAPPTNVQPVITPSQTGQ
jgi:hypothetical protein